MPSVQTIILNTSNYVSDSGNRFTYKFNTNKIFTEKHRIGLQSISIYNSSFNIISDYGNNTLSIQWLGINYYLTITDGYYSASTLNYLIQQFCVLNNLYCEVGTDTIKNVYFFEIIENPPEYTININTYHLMTASEASALSYSIPSGASWTFPTSNLVNTTNNISITLSTGLAYLLGYTSATFPNLVFPSPRADTYNNLNDVQHSSDSVPAMQYVSSYVLTCSMVKSEYAYPSSVFMSIPVSVAFGTILDYKSTTLIYSDIFPGNYSEISIELLNQNYQPLKFQDKQVLIILSVLDEN